VYGAADMAGVSRLQYTTETKLIRVMCTGRVDLSFILRAFSNGLDGVFVGGCRLNECNYITHGNFQALSMVHLCKRLMEHIGLNPDRLRIDFMSAGDGIIFAEVMNDFGKKVKTLGPLGSSEGLSEADLKTRLNEVSKLVPYIKVVKKEKLAKKLDSEKAYSELYSKDEVDKIFTELAAYYIEPAKCQACSMCLRRCPVGAINGAKNKIHIIDQEKCIKCGTCFEVCPPKIRAIQKLAGVPAPPPVPEDQRTVVRAGPAK
jgi:F420-non-reducing hydrogenase iron-sulfur subunit